MKIYMKNWKISITMVHRSNTDIENIYVAAFIYGVACLFYARTLTTEIAFPNFSREENRKRRDFAGIYADTMVFARMSRTKLGP